MKFDRTNVPDNLEIICNGKTLHHIISIDDETLQAVQYTLDKDGNLILDGDTAKTHILHFKTVKVVPSQDDPKIIVCTR